MFVIRTQHVRKYIIHFSDTLEAFCKGNQLVCYEHKGKLVFEPHPTRAIADLETVRKEVFGDGGPFAHIFANDDRARELADVMRNCLVILGKLVERAQAAATPTGRTKRD